MPPRGGSPPRSQDIEALPPSEEAVPIEDTGDIARAEEGEELMPFLSDEIAGVADIEEIQRMEESDVIRGFEEQKQGGDYLHEMNDSEEVEAIEASCRECGLPRSEWENAGRGFVRYGQAYCCEGCADGSGCTCGS